MFAKFAPFATVLALALGAAADLTLSTPASVPQCGKVSFSVGGATGSYSMFVVKPSDPCGDSIADVHNLSGASFDWIANLPEGTDIQFEIEDDDGNAGWSGALKVGPGDAGCLSGASTTASATSASSSSSSSSTPRSTLRVGSDVPANVADDGNAAFSTRSLSGFAGLAIAAAAAVLAL